MQFSIQKTIWAGFIGFLFSAMVFAIPFWNNKSPYQEARFSFQEKIDSLLGKRADRLDSTVKRLGDSIKASSGDAKAKFKTQFEEIRKLQAATYNEMMRCNTDLTDTLNKAQLQYFNIGVDTFSNWLRQKLDTLGSKGQDSIRKKNTALGYNGSIIANYLPVQIRDTLLLADSAPMRHAFTNIQGTYIRHKSAFGFFSQQPNFALWLLLSLAQGLLWGMVIVFIGSLKPDSAISGIVNTSPLAFFDRSFWTAVMVTGLFCLAIYWCIIDTYALPEHLFMKDFNRRLVFYAIPGYLAAALCFTGYLKIPEPLEVANTINMKANQTTSPDVEAMKKNLHTFLFITVAILCFFVVWLSSLFNSINELPALKTYTMVSGKKLLPNDFVYIMGLAHSLLLALFYVPVQLRLRALEPKCQNGGADDNTPPLPPKWWKTVLSTLMSLLVPITPLLTALLKGLIDDLK